MRITLEHFHCLMARNRGDFDISQIRVLEEPARCFVPQIVKSQIKGAGALARFRKRIGYRSAGVDREYLLSADRGD
jgi:hypothetical protein